MEKGTSQEKAQMKGVAEAILFASGEPVSRTVLARVLDLSSEEVIDLMTCLAEDYRQQDRGLRLVRVNETWQLSTKPEYYAYIEPVIGERENTGLSKAALETLAIIAYKQPITRIEIDQLRGVSSNSSVQRLLDKGLIKEAGRMEAPGRPILYKTTPAFLKTVQLESIECLPAFEQFSENGVFTEEQKDGE